MPGTIEDASVIDALTLVTPSTFHSKEGVVGSSPTEGSHDPQGFYRAAVGQRGEVGATWAQLVPKIAPDGGRFWGLDPGRIGAAEGPSKGCAGVPEHGAVRALACVRGSLVAAARRSTGSVRRPR
jgi:hypothetical protein